jgi:hypothetical protein
MDLIPECIRLRARNAATTEAGLWIRAFHQFLEQEYTMRAFTEEVWIVSGGTTPLWPNGMSFHDTHALGGIYYCLSSHAKRPLYLAFRVRGQVTHIQKVLSVHHEAKPVDFLPALKNVPADWPNLPHTVWKLSAPTPLPRPIPTGDNTMRARRFSCDLDILLASSTIRDAIAKMKARRQSRA